MAEPQAGQEQADTPAVALAGRKDTQNEELSLPRADLVVTQRKGDVLIKQTVRNRLNIK
jgi:hypothetical protein